MLKLPALACPFDPVPCVQIDEALCIVHAAGVNSGLQVNAAATFLQRSLKSYFSARLDTFDMPKEEGSAPQSMQSVCRALDYWNKAIAWFDVISAVSTIGQVVTSQVVTRSRST